MKISQSFDTISLKKAKTSEEAIGNVNALTDKINSLVGQLNTMKRDIQRAETGATAITIINADGSTTTTTTSQFEYRAYYQSISAEGGYISFRTPLANASYNLSVWLIADDGDFIRPLAPQEYFTASGFTVTKAGKEGTLFYVAIPHR